MSAPRTLSAGEVRAAVPMGAAVDAVREAFRELANGRFTQPNRLVFGDDAQAVLVMSAHHQPSGSAVVKTIGLVLDRVPAILGTLVWTDRDGQLVADASTVTTLRTGAVAGVATDLLAPPDARRLTLLGAGAQAADQVRAVLAVREIRELTVFNRDRAKAEALVTGLAAEFPWLSGRVAASAEEAVGQAQIVCCATSSSTPLFDAAALPGRVHVNAIGSFRPSMRELPPELLQAASAVVVDQLEAAVEEAGEIIHALDTGLLERAAIRELGPALADPPDRTGRTVFKSVGVAAQDWAIARLLAARIRAVTA
ncbi:ornithine cyclodeaminase family protein [Amycolatopsis sp. H20-H5]|uniref:ornithine cyclodeaminase family protein n=1 Tax=Amycolatopsis sp. H20-H5 TaxID=3046309 RepID=UPI002DB7F9A5|nr:ornithine cyclodeaminase family protein [Amycolatopsis sp. H20-H5]MEC3977361.1 ornithine cyclodeaminase family protein [Amycolatopsis sp. H20-H5]